MTYTYNYDTTSIDTNALAGFGALIGLYVLICLALAVFMLISMWKVYEKAGKPGWAVIVPIYNSEKYYYI